MNIVGGEFKGRKLQSPKGDRTRPTSGMLRKAVFDICRNEIEGAAFLDLFAGTGAMGLEALSRGANLAVFIDKDKKAIECIKANIATLKVEDRAKVIMGDVLSAVKRLDTPFTIIYIDPPYDLAYLIPEILNLIVTKNKQALIFVEEGTPSSLKIEEFTSLLHKDTRKFGNSLLHKFEVL